VIEFAIGIPHLMKDEFIDGVGVGAGRQHCIGRESGCLLDFDDLQFTESFSAMKAYGRSKLCNILFTRELSRRLKRRPRLSDVHI
jgi:hypothetical protein